MTLEEALEAIRGFYARSPYERFWYVVFPVRPYPASPGRALAAGLSDLAPIRISLPDLLYERYGNRWERLLAAEQEGRLSEFAPVLEHALKRALEATAPGSLVILSGLEILRLIPLNLTAFVLPLARERTVLALLKGTLTRSGVKVLGVEPELPSPPNLRRPLTVEVDP